LQVGDALLMDENIGRYFSPWNIYACHSTARPAIEKRMAQARSTHQIGLTPTFHGVLILVW
jgi:hypothetical protein